MEPVAEDRTVYPAISLIEILHRKVFFVNILKTPGIGILINEDKRKLNAATSLACAMMVTLSLGCLKALASFSLDVTNVLLGIGFQ